eukprot:CAMPEP_0119337050 /NCGR_PEP_ID=MMETSP1333-20130426/93174_1 /TAXON_ID=418940 /ORGANISM="Scyphosphaera apsteinii, Strain RCC1455" /LENGTH=251 /DNA_ID=CAMNT_0007348013 /DNA_START=32 /DNA_END=784 /DNA_ORIENTATION=+
MRLLAFGDSLTAGYHALGTAFSPWADNLARSLGVNWRDGKHIGLSGWTARQLASTLDMAQLGPDNAGRCWPGLRATLEHARPDGYDLVVIMVGTNDLADKERPEGIVQCISRLHSEAHAHGSRTVAVNIPESKVAMCVPWLGELRLRTNLQLEEWAAQQGDRVLYVDMAAEIPYASDSGMWEPDGLHFSAHGYQEFGIRLAPHLRRYVSTWPAEAANRPASAHSIGDVVRLHGLQTAQYNDRVGVVEKVGT